MRRNALGVYAVYVAAVISGLVVTPTVVHAVGTDGFGVWSFIGSITIYLSILDFGVGPSVIRFAARARGQGSDEETNAIASTGLAFYLSVGAATVPVGLGLSWFSPQLVGAPDGLIWATRVATALAVAALVLRFPLGLFNNLLVARQRWDIQNLAALVSTALYALLVVLLIPRWESIVLLAGLSFGTTIVRLALPMLWLRRELPALRLRRAFVTRARLRALASFSWSNFLVHIANKVVFSTDLVVVGIVLGAVASGVYAIPAKLFALAFGIGTAAPALLFPAFAELEGSGDLERQRRLFLSGLRFGMALMLLLALPLLLIPDELIQAWVGIGYGKATVVMVLLALVLLVHQPIFLFTQYLIARGIHRELAIVLIAITAANLGLSVALAASVGIWGVAASTLATDAVLLVYVVARFATAAPGSTVRMTTCAVVRPVAPASVVAFVVLVLGARVVYRGDTLLQLLPVGALWIVAGGLTIWAFGLDAAERALVRAQLRVRPLRATAPDPT